MENVVPVLMPNNNREFSQERPEHLAMVRAFATAHFGEFETKVGSGNPVKWFKCCDAFCTRGCPAGRTHAEGRFVTYADLKREHDFDSAQGFAAILEELFVRDREGGRRVYLPTLNTVHFRHFDDLQDVQRLRDQIVKKDEKIGNLGKRLQDKEELVDCVREYYTKEEKKASSLKESLQEAEKKRDTALKEVTKIENKLKYYVHQLEKYKLLKNGCEDCKHRRLESRKDDFPDDDRDKKSDSN